MRIQKKIDDGFTFYAVEDVKALVMDHYAILSVISSSETMVLLILKMKIQSEKTLEVDAHFQAQGLARD